MVVYNFKSMAPVPAVNDFIDIVLTRTQRQTPTVVHPGYKITRIRQFYMRKVKFTQQTTSERLGKIVSDFPRVDDVHPFYADLLNVLYDRDHYKLALGQVNTAKKLIETLGRDYVRLLKYGDSLYRCKQLKRAALGRMMTLLKRLKPSLAYLEEVRRHMMRLPSLDPSTRTLLLAGFPNVGKSSFLNQITRANVDVQPYAFTTKSLYVGHMDYRYLRWQVIDTPGLLDHSLSDRNTIEMQAVTALAHIPCCVLYFIDPSGQCGYTVEQQVSLFNSIKPLFANKQLLVVCNKSDVMPLSEAPEEDRAAIEGLTKAFDNVELLHISNINQQGVTEVKSKACDKLLTSRVSARLVGGKVNSVMNRLTVAQPAKRDNVERGTSIPESVISARLAKSNGMDVDDGSTTRFMRKTQKERMWEGGGPGVYSADYREYYDLKNKDWRFDAIPEIMDGKNIADFVDPEIEKRLEDLENEEEQILGELADQAAMASDESEVEEEERELSKAIRTKRALKILENRASRSRNKVVMPRRGRSRSVAGMERHFDNIGLPSKMATERVRKRGRSTSRSNRNIPDIGAAEVRNIDFPSAKKQRAASSSRAATPAPNVGIIVIPMHPLPDSHGDEVLTPC